MEPEDNMESDLSPRHVAHVSSSLPFTEPSQSLSPPPGPSGIISLLSPPQPDITPNQPPISTSNQYQLAATINRLHLAASNQRQTATTTLSSSAQNHSAAQTGNSISAQTQASARTIQSAVTNRDGGRAQITGPTASPAVAVRRGATPTTVGSSRATGGGSTNSNIFQIPLSQDILAGSNDLSLGLGESQSVDASIQSLPPGPPLGYDFTPPDMRALIRADEQRQMAEDVRQSQLEKEGREVLARVLAEEGRSSDLQFGGRSYPLRGNEETVTPASQSDSGSQDQPALPPYSNELTQRANRRIKRLRDRLKGTPVVPGTESSRSSDEGKAASLRAAKLKMEHRITSGVPESTLSTHSRASKALDNQIVVVTGASESGLSSSEGGRRVPKKRSAQTQHKTMPSTVEVTRAPTTPSPEEEETRRDEALSEDSTTDEETQDIEPPPVITASIKLASPSWGAETDASTEYPGTQTTSSGSDKATPSSGSSCSVDGSQATVPQTLPLVSSTPYEDDVTTALPGLLGLYKICKKQLSNETSSSTTTTSSGGDIEKIRANRRTQIHSQRTQEESLGSFEVPLALQTLSAEMHDPAPPQSDEVGAPSSLQSEIETQPLDDSSHDIFHNLSIVRDSQEELANEKPAWYAKMMDETQVMDPADDGKKTGDKIQRLEQAQPSAKSKITSSPQSKSQSQPFFKNPNSSTSCSPASKDSSFTGSQGPSTSSSSSNSSKSSLPTSSSTCSSNDPGSVISSNTSSDSSNSTHQQSISVRSNDEQEAMDTNPSSQNPVTKSGKEDDQVKENHSEDDDNTVTLEMESPIMIDLTCQSQSLGEGENQECDKSTSLIHVETLCSPDILHVSVEKSTEEMEDLLRDDEAMDTDTASQDSFCLHYSPSQNHPIRETSAAASKETTPLNSMESEEFSLQNTMNPASSCKRNLLNIEVDNSQTLKADDSKSLQNLSPTAIVSRTQSPLYESLLLDNSSESIQGSIKSRSVTALMPTEVTHGVQQHESPAHTPTSAPFRLNLPSGSLIEPLTTITPPSQPAHTIQLSAPPAVAGTTSNADRLPTGDKSTVLQIPASPLSVLSSTDTDSVLSNRNTRQSDTDSFGLHLDTATSGSSQISEDEINHSIPDPLQKVVDQPLSTSDTTERQSVARNEEEVKISAESTNLDGSEDSQAAEESVTVSTCLKNSSDVQSITREATGSPRTPRKSLSLKNRRTPKRPGKESQKPENTTVPGFVLGVLSENSEQSEVDSQIPKVIVLGDSQLECSDSFNLPFSIALPKEASSTASVDTAKALASENQNHGALFSGFRSDATSRVTGRQVSDSCVISESLFNQSKEPYEPQSQYSEVQFVRPRKQRNMPGSVFDSVEVGGSQAAEGTNLEQIPHASSAVRSLDQSNEIEPMCVDPPSFGSPSIIQESIQLVDNSIGNHPDNNSTNSSSQEATLSEADRNSQVNNPSSQNLITPTNSQILHPPTIITSLQHPSSSRGLSNSQSCAASFQSPVPSTPLEFTSPYSMISPSGMEELKKQVRREGVNRYELRHVRTIRTVTDHRIVSSEVIKNNRVMNGSSRVWSETCEPEVFQEVKVEMAPRHPLINSSFSFPTSPQLVSTTMIPNVGSSMNIINSQSSLVDSPISSQLCGQENHRNSRETTPTVSHRNSRPPIRRVYPIPSSEDRDTNSSASSHESIDHDHSTTSRTVNREANTRPSVKATQEPSTIRKRASRLPGATPNATYSLCESVRSASKQAGSSTTHSAQTSRKVPKPTTSATKDGCDAEPAALEVGTKVIAKWKDKCWYIATIITDKNKQGRMRVKYADEDTGSVTASNVLLTEFLSEGVSVSAVPILSQSQSSDTLQPDTTVTGVFEGFSDEAQETFVLRSGNELKTFSSACLCVQSDAIKSCTLDSKIPHKTMVNRKRKRCSVKESDGVTLPSSTKKKRLSSGTTTTAISRGQGHMFRGYVFMLTQRTKEDSQTASPKTSIDKETAVKQIRSKAGRIADTLTKQEVIDGRTFVLSDSFCKTKKYLLGLALDVPCITYSWLSDCIQQGKVLDYADYRLPAGVNNFDGTVIPWSPCSRSIMFKECTVHVVGIETFKRHWGSIAEACGASILSKLPTMTARSRSNSGSVVVVAEHPDQISPSLQHQSSLDTLCILSHTWIVQCLIQGQLLSYDRFRINKC